MFDPEKHRRRSIRLKNYDYSKKGFYFLTLCTYGRIHLFGEIKGGKMILNPEGTVVENCWKAIPSHFPNAILHDYAIMPNHVHGIIELTEPIDSVGVENFLPLQNHTARKRNKFQKMIPRSIGSIVKGFKIGVTKHFRNHTDVHTVWQRNYYDRIIRDKKSFENIARYIRNNPKSW